MSYDQEMRERAGDMYINEGMPLKEVSKALNIPERTVENWSVEDEWSENRQEYRSAIASIKRNTVILKKKLISKALKSLESMDSIGSQDMHGFRSVLAAAEAGGGDQPAMIQGEPREIRTAEDAVAALQEAVQSKLNAMLSQPGAINLGAIKDVKKVMELIEEMRAAAKPEEKEKKRKQLDPETIRAIREEVYGLI